MSVRTKPQLLVAFDREGDLDTLSRRLVRHGFDVDTVGSGRDVLKQVEEGEYDLVVLDITTSGSNGIDVLKSLRQRYSNRELPIITATAHDASEKVVEALELGANDYVTKPIDFPGALARVQSQLQQQGTQQREPRLTTGPGALLDGKYRLEEPLGSGSFATVYRAKHVVLEQAVAVKVFSVGSTPPSEIFARFRREGTSAERVRHPNAVSVIDFGITGAGTAYLVMELLEGHSLDEELKERGTLPAARCLEILRPICQVLSEIHAAGMVHLDMKPANIFLHRARSGEVVKVLDFGVAELLGDVSAERSTTTGHIEGTPAFIAPERFGGEPFDGRADIYSVGIMLYRMLGGRMPFASQYVESLAMQHLRETPPPLSKLNPLVTPPIQEVVLQAMSKKLDERPSAAQLLKLFGRALQRRASDR